MTTQQTKLDGEPKFTRDEIISIATLCCATLLAITAIGCRWFVTYQGQGIRLMLVMAGLTAAMILVGRNGAKSPLERICIHAFAAFTVIALMTWSPGFAFALLVTMPVLLTLIVPPLMSLSGYQFQLTSPLEISESSRHISDSDGELIELPNPVPPATQLSEASEEIHVEDETCEEEDPWAFVHDQFSQDQSFVQNVAQWVESGGARSTVANIRCRFSTVDETCIVHLPFWPILNSAPEVFSRVVSGPDATVKTTHELPHGLRLEVRLNDRSNNASLDSTKDVIVEVVASVAAETSEIAA